MTSLIDLLVRENEFVIVSYNLRSILPKIDSLQIMVNESKPDILNINETWLKDTIPDQLVSLEGYDLIRHDRKTNHKGGGVASDIKQTMVPFMILNHYYILKNQIVTRRCNFLRSKLETLRK